jgi:orotate phosphoribosyltransferase-like protein
MGTKFISLAKAAELLNISREDLLFLIDKIGFNYSFFTSSDVEIEKKAINEFMSHEKRTSSFKYLCFIVPFKT